MSHSQTPRWALILIVALALRLAAGGWWQWRLDGRFLFADSDGYWSLGRAIAAGDPYQYGPHGQVFRTPGYPLLLAPIFRVAGREPSIFWGRAESALLGTLAVAAVGWLGWELFDAQVGWLAALLATFYPGAIAMASCVLSEAPFCGLMVAQLAAWVRAWKSRSPGRTASWALTAGLLAGGASLVRPSWLPFAPFAIAVGLACCRSRRRQAWIGGLLLVAQMALMTPWWIRNARLTGHFVPTTLQVGASLYDGLNPQATGASDMRFVPRFMEMERRQPGPENTPPDSLEYRVDRRLREEATHWAIDHPGRVAQLAATKLTRLWNVWPNESRFSGWPTRLLVVFTYVPILILVIMGAGRTIRSGWPYILCWLPAVYVSLIHVVFVSSIRYREPVLLPWMVLAAAVVWAGRVEKRGDPAKEGGFPSSGIWSTAVGSSSSGSSCWACPPP
jgi:hypothetical protein